jgi:hypothetical protein
VARRAARATCRSAPTATCSITLTEAPAEVSFVLEDASGAVLTDQTTTPDYRQVRPNGDDCPPTCEQGEVYIGW